MVTENYSVSSTSEQQPSLPLSERHRRELHEDSGIPLDVIAERGYRTITRPAELLEVGFADWQAKYVPGLLVPLNDTEGRNSRFAYKADHPRISKKTGKPVKYDWPLGTSPILDVPERSLSDVPNAEVPLLLPEGVKKADAGVAAAKPDPEGPARACLINIHGVFNFGWRDKTNRVQLVIEGLPDWKPIVPTLPGRKCYVSFDSDSISKPQVGLAERRLAWWLAKHGAVVYFIRLHDAPDGSKQGLDDDLATFAPEDRPARLQALMDAAEPYGSEQLRARVRQLEEERTAIFAALHNPRLSATERIAGVFTVFRVAEELSHPSVATEVARITVDAHDSVHCKTKHCDPTDRHNPCLLDHKHDPDRRCPLRVGLAPDIGLSPNTVRRAHDVLFDVNKATPGGPLSKKTIDDKDNRERKIGQHVEFKPTCTGGVPGQLWALARYDPKKQTQHGGPREQKPDVEPRCEHCPGGTWLRTTCTKCGSVVAERPNPPQPPEHQLDVPVAVAPRGAVLSSPEPQLGVPVSGTPDIAGAPSYVLNGTDLVFRPGVGRRTPAERGCFVCGRSRSEHTTAEIAAGCGRVPS